MGELRRGRLTVYLGAAPGVGKTFAMLDEAHRRRARGTDVVIALVETHGRAATAAQVGDLEIVPRAAVAYRGTALEEMDVAAVLHRAPEVALVDELAHTNAPGARHPKRWQDVHELLAAGIDVVTTVNIQHLESIGDDVKAITGIRQRETVPDHVVRGADQVQLVDLPPDALRRRLAHGNVYRAEQIDASLSSYFRVGNLTALRELALLWLADSVDDALTQYRADHAIAEAWPARERIVVAVTGGPEGQTLLRRGARIAQRSAGSELLAVHVLATDGLPSAGPAAIAADRALVEDLGGTLHTVVGEDVPSAVVDFAHGVNATMIVVGVSRHSRLREAVLGSSGAQIAQLAGAIDVHLVTHERARAGNRPRRRWSPLSPARQTMGWLFALLVPAVLSAVLLWEVESATLPTELMLFLAGTVGVALVGGLWPAIVAALTSFFCLNWFFTAPTGMLTVADPENVLALVVFVLIAAAVASVVDLAARRSAQAYRARAEASTLAALSRSVLSGGDTAEAVVARLAETFAVPEVRLEERLPDRDEWDVVAHTERAGMRAQESPEKTVISISADRRLVVVGRVLPASDHRVLEAFAAQAGVMLVQRRLREQAAQASVLEQADAARTALLAAVSHDLRTPLASIRAALDGLSSPDVALAEDDRRALLDTMGESTARLERLIANLLDLSRIQAGGVRAALRPWSVDEFVPLALEPFTSEEVQLDVPDNLPLVLTDAGLVERVVANIAANAVRFSPPGVPVHITASQRPGEVELRIADRGPGLDQQGRDRMFEPFQRLGDSTPGGLGLGLAVAAGLARAVGASLVADDTPGGGLTMVLTLPTVPDEGEGAVTSP